MKKIIFALALLPLLSGCVSRTVSRKPIINSSGDASPSGYGATSQDKVLEKKIIWFWQEDFRKPK